jgi:hypothetical protein
MANLSVIKGRKYQQSLSQGVISKAGQKKRRPQAAHYQGKKQSVNLVVFFPRLCAGHGFFPAAVTEIALGGFDTRAEFTLNVGFALHFIQIVPVANRQACQISRP